MATNVNNDIQLVQLNNLESNFPENQKTKFDFWGNRSVKHFVESIQKFIGSLDRKAIAELFIRGALIAGGITLIGLSIGAVFPLVFLLPVGFAGAILFGLGCADYPCSQLKKIKWPFGNETI